MLKDEILKDLSCGKTISGQALADKYGVSRTAVWKAVSALKKSGYTINGANKSGYTLEGRDLLSPAEISADAEKYMRNRGLEKGLDGIEIICAESMDSTNAEAKRLAAERGADRLIVAGTQTDGRGRLGRSFYSPEKTGAYFSLALHGRTEIPNAVKFTSLAAVSVCRAIENLTGRSPMIKWVNDVYVRGGKACGILTEAVADVESGKISDVVIGIGVNLTTENFPEGIQAASLACENVTRSRIISAVALEIINGAEGAMRGDHIPYYRAHDMLCGKEIFYTMNGEKRSGVAAGIGDNGGLIVKTENGEITLTGGEVTVRVK